MSAAKQVEAGSSYLQGGEAYYSTERLSAMQRVFSILGKDTFSPQICVCLGAGGRQEPVALQNMFPSISMVVPVDLSYTVAQHASHPEQDIFPVQANVGQLPFANNSVYLIVAKSVLHEVASYSPNGFFTLQESIRQSLDALSSGGKLYYLDFTPPDQDIIPYGSMVQVEMKTELAMQLYTLMSEHYRKFENGFWSEFDKSKLDNIRAIDDFFPKPINGRVDIPVSTALELFLHLPPYFNDLKSGIFPTQPHHWKEIQEQYFIEGPEGLLTPEMQLSLFHRDDVVLEHHFWNNPGTVSVLKEHLNASILGLNIDSETIFAQSTRKLIVSATKI